MGTAPRFAKPQGASPCVGSGGATGLPPLMAESLLVSPMKADIPGRCFRESRRRPHAQTKLLSPKTKIKSEGGHPFPFYKAQADRNLGGAGWPGVPGDYFHFFSWVVAGTADCRRFLRSPMDFAGNLHRFLQSFHAVAARGCQFQRPRPNRKVLDDGGLDFLKSIKKSEIFTDPLDKVRLIIYAHESNR